MTKRIKRFKRIQIALYSAAVFCVFWLYVLDTFLYMVAYVPKSLERSTFVDDDTVKVKIVEKQRVFVNYVYSGEGERSDSDTNLLFFLKHGVTIPNNNVRVDYGLTVNGKCDKKICRTPELFMTPNEKGNTPLMKVLNRPNTGYDFGGHTSMLESLDEEGKTKYYDVFVFLNDGVVGPIVPSYMPDNWHWTLAFLDRLKPKYEPGGEIGLISTSIVCLPHTDLGGFGPKVEAFTFAISRHALEIVRSVGTSFQQHKNKKSAIILGEYALTSVLMNNDIGIDSLLKSYKGIDWKDQKNWHCNDNIHPTRENTYFGQSINPLEVIFHKPHWAGNPPVNKEILEMYMNFDEMSAERQKQKDLNRFMI